jgi:hypothetical protein
VLPLLRVSMPRTARYGSPFTLLGDNDWSYGL